MSIKTHTKDDSTQGACRANKRGCPKGQSEEQHQYFESAAEIRAHNDRIVAKKMEDENDTLCGTRKSSKKKLRPEDSWKEGYKKALTEAVLKKGIVVENEEIQNQIDTALSGEQPFTYGIYGDHRHSQSCTLTAREGSEPKEIVFNEFVDSFDGSDNYVHSVVLKGVDCECGKYKNATIYRRDSLSSIITDVLKSKS